jgi:hypothetical protein
MYARRALDLTPTFYKLVIAYLVNWLLGAYSAPDAPAPCPTSVLASAGVLPRGMQPPIRFFEPAQ